MRTDNHSPKRRTRRVASMLVGLLAMGGTLAVLPASSASAHSQVGKNCDGEHEVRTCIKLWFHDNGRSARAISTIRDLSGGLNWEVDTTLAQVQYWNKNTKRWQNVIATPVERHYEHTFDVLGTGYDSPCGRPYVPVEVRAKGWYRYHAGGSVTYEQFTTASHNLSCRPS